MTGPGPRLAIGLAAAAILCACDAQGTPALTAACTGERDVVVTDAATLSAAVAAAQPGDAITLAPGAYRIRLELANSGDPDNPIQLCGTPNTTIEPGDGGYGIHLAGASWWQLRQLQVRGGQKGIVLDGADHNLIESVSVSGTGMEGIHLRAGSSDNLVRSVAVSQTGLRKPSAGEGIYVGSARGNWCRYSDCQPDASDRNQLIEVSFGAGISAENVDIKEGTTGGAVTASTFSGQGLTGADSWIDIKGNDWTVSNNRGSGPAQDAIQVHRVAPGWGEGNTITNNDLQFSGSGFGVWVQPGTHGNTVACSNQVPPTAAGVANVACQD